MAAMDAPMTISTAMVREWDHETANTRRMLERVPWEKRDWRPHPKSMTLGRLALHIAQLAGRPAAILNSDGLDVAAPRPQAAEPHSTADLLASFDQGVAASRAALAGADPERLAQPWTLRRGEQIMASMPRAAAIRNMGMNHAVHHRAQLGVYLRLNDVPIPGMYGPSADEA
jgi:uncharacterized damage-inducible protein DinB